MHPARRMRTVQPRVLKEDRVNVAFEMINGDEGKVVGESEGFGVGDADEQCTSEARARSDGNGIEIGEVNVGFSKRGADNGNDGAKVLAAGELGHDAAVERVGRDLRGNDGRKSSRSALTTAAAVSSQEVSMPRMRPEPGMSLV